MMTTYLAGRSIFEQYVSLAPHAAREMMTGQSVARRKAKDVGTRSPAPTRGQPRPRGRVPARSPQPPAPVGTPSGVLGCGVPGKDREGPSGPSGCRQETGTSLQALITATETQCEPEGETRWSYNVVATSLKRRSAPACLTVRCKYTPVCALMWQGPVREPAHPRNWSHKRGSSSTSITGSTNVKGLSLSKMAPDFRSLRCQIKVNKKKKCPRV